MKNILYIHGMGGGGDSRIPFILQDRLSGYKDIRVIVRTYSFDPEVASGQIALWVKELAPKLIVGESLGAIQAIRIKGIPHILVSPSLGAPLYLGYLAFLALIPGVTWLLSRIYKPKPGDRQCLDFTFRTLTKYRLHRRLALENSPAAGSHDSFFAFFGSRDHYRKSAVVSVRVYRKWFGDGFAIYDGTHYMEEEYVRGMLADKILDWLRDD